MLYDKFAFISDDIGADDALTHSTGWKLALILRSMHRWICWSWFPWGLERSKKATEWWD